MLHTDEKDERIGILEEDARYGRSENNWCVVVSGKAERLIVKLVDGR